MEDREVISEELQHGEEIPFPEPERVVITIVKEGEYQKELPTITFVYRDDVECLQPVFLHAAENATIDEVVNEDEEVGLNLVAYFRPQEGDEVNFSQRRILNFPTADASKFAECAEATGRFVWVVSHPDFKFRALVNFETTEIIEAIFENRFLH